LAQHNRVVVGKQIVLLYFRLLSLAKGNIATRVFPGESDQSLNKKLEALYVPVDFDRPGVFVELEG